MNAYSIAVKRAEWARHTIGEALTVIQNIADIDFKSSTENLTERSILVVEASDAAIKRVRELIGEFCHVEDEIRLTRLEKTA